MIYDLYSLIKSEKTQEERSFVVVFCDVLVEKIRNVFIFVSILGLAHAPGWDKVYLFRQWMGRLVNAFFTLLTSHQNWIRGAGKIN